MSQQEQNLTTSSIDMAEVIRFLQAHPHFFAEHSELLMALELRHASGTAVSLIERQVGLLREKNQHLEHKLQQLVQRARDNEALNERMQSLALGLLNSDSLMTSLHTLRDAFLHEFSIEQVAIRLIAWPESNVTTIDTELTISASDATDLFNDLFTAQRVICGRPGKAQAEALFGENAEQIKSMALIPLHSGCNFGLLALGSADSQRFQANLGVHFLSQAGELLSARLKTWLSPLK